MVTSVGWGPGCGCGGVGQTALGSCLSKVRKCRRWNEDDRAGTTWVYVGLTGGSSYCAGITTQ